MKPDMVVARNYALAFINSFGQKLVVKDFLAINDLFIFWGENKQLFFFLQVPSIKIDKKNKLLHDILDKMSMPDPLKDLFSLLVEHKRAFLIREVLGQICSLYKKKKDILFFKITSAHELLNDELEVVKNFLAQKTGKTILCDCAIDKKLIAGIRCHSETLVWEHSVRKRLHDLRKQLILQRAT